HENNHSGGWMIGLLGVYFFLGYGGLRHLTSFTTRRSSDLAADRADRGARPFQRPEQRPGHRHAGGRPEPRSAGHRRRRHVSAARSEEHTSELQSREKLVCRLLLEKKKVKIEIHREIHHTH